jgi:hypothetical protein
LLVRSALYSDFETSAVRQSSLQSSIKPKEIFLKILNCFEQVYRQVSMRFLLSSNELARMAALNTMLKTNLGLAETFVLPELLSRMKALEDKAAKGVFIP